MSEHFLVLEVSDAEFFAGPLFKRVFGAPPPAFPRHFVCLYRSEAGDMRSAGYVHFSAFESLYLAGGLVVDKTLYASIPKEHLDEVGPNRSIGGYVMAEGIGRLTDAAAVFAFIGDARSVTVNLAIGYVPTHIEKLYAYWKRDFPEEIRRAAAERVMRIAPF